MDDPFFAFVAVGFVAQLIDGALGMAYGVASTTALVFLGVPPAIASANVHVAEVFTTAASGTSHAIARNIDWRLFRRLALAGSTGAVLGAFFISFIQPDLQILLQPWRPELYRDIPEDLFRPSSRRHASAANSASCR